MDQTTWLVIIIVVALVTAAVVIWVVFGSVENFWTWVTGQQTTVISQLEARTAFSQCQTACTMAKSAGTCVAANPPKVKIDLDNDNKIDTIVCDSVGTVESWGDTSIQHNEVSINEAWGGWNLNCCG